MENKISVNLAQRSYDIIVGADSIEKLSDYLGDKSYSKIFVITDENVDKLHSEKLLEVLQKTNITTEKIVTKAGEQTKSFESLQNVCEQILSKGVDRKSLIIAFGGGVIGDLSGFVASILLRGIDFIQVPTTLLSAVDSSVGGKTAINSSVGKNLIGSFYQPQLVLCDLNFLQTLPIRELKSGYAEVVKYGFICDLKFFEFLEKSYSKIFEYDAEILQKIIIRSCQIKAEVVSNDEREAGQRALLNFGHTFGHLFETETGYSDKILHGEAVALGMVMAAKMSLNFGMILETDYLRVEKHLKECGFVINAREIQKKWDNNSLISHLYKDKKTEGKNLTFILLNSIGSSIIKKSVDLEAFKKVLIEFI